MILVFIYWGNYDGLNAVLACAKARAECPIYVISDSQPPSGVNHIPISDYSIGGRMMELFCSNNICRWAAFSLSRWYILRDFMISRELPFPVFCADWDVMIFRNLAKSYEPFREKDFTVSYEGAMSSAAYGVNHIDPLNAYCTLIEKQAHDGGDYAATLNDMEAWARTYRAHLFKVGNLHEIHNGSVFDHSMHCGQDRFAFDGEAKRLEFHEHNPYFVLKDGQTRIAANTIHCWGSYKHKPNELAKHAGITV